MITTAPWLEINNLRLARGGREVLNLDHLSLPRGETLALIGPNGAGKSTLLLALAALMRPVTGRIAISGLDYLAGGELAHRRRLALVLQEPLLLDGSVADNIAAGLRFRRLPRPEIAARVTTWLERLGIAHLTQRSAARLSGGEAQRVSLARAFALQPDLLLLDEPFRALDPPSRASLLAALHDLLRASPNLTTLFVTHDLDEALMLGDRVAVLLAGRLRQVDQPLVVFNAPADPEVAAFVGVETIIPGIVQSTTAGLLTIKTAQGALLEAVGEALPGTHVLLCLRPEDITLSPAPSQPEPARPRSSARNLLVGQIERLIPQGPLVRVMLDCGFTVSALITRQSAADLSLLEGLPVQATFKATAGHLIIK
jgi:tungstate transport system ATP-binding protein